MCHFYFDIQTSRTIRQNTIIIEVLWSQQILLKNPIFFLIHPSNVLLIFQDIKKQNWYYGFEIFYEI
jgi:hypothetical protein